MPLPTAAELTDPNATNTQMKQRLAQLSENVESKEGAQEKLNDAKLYAESVSTSESLKRGYLANRLLILGGSKPSGISTTDKENIGFKSGQQLFITLTTNATSGTWFTLRGQKSDDSFVDIIARTAINGASDINATLNENFKSFRLITESTAAYTATANIFEVKPLQQATVENAILKTNTNESLINALDASAKSGYLTLKMISLAGVKTTDVTTLTINKNNNGVFKNGESVYLKFDFNNINCWFNLRGYKADGSYDNIIARTSVTSIAQSATLAADYMSFRVILEQATGTNIPLIGGIFVSEPIATSDITALQSNFAFTKSQYIATRQAISAGYMSAGLIDFSGVKATGVAALTVNKNNNDLFKSGEQIHVKADYESYELWFNLRGYKADGSYDNIIARTALKSVNQSVTLTADYVSFRMIFDYATGPVINVSASMSLGDPIRTSEIRTLQTDQAILLNSAKPFIGKKYFAVGDSITMNATDWNATQGGYIYSILQNTGMTFVGSTGASGNGMPLMLFARNMKTLAATIANADVLTVLGGTNDYHSLSAYTIGSFADEAVPYSQLETVSPMSIYQAVKTIIKCAQAIKPSIKIVFFTEPERGTYVNGGTSYPSTHTPPNASPNGLTMHGIAYAIKDCANRLGVSAFDTHADLWTFEQVASACPDMLHPSKNISTKMGELFSKRINSLVPIL